MSQKDALRMAFSTMPARDLSKLFGTPDNPRTWHGTAANGTSVKSLKTQYDPRTLKVKVIDSGGGSIEGSPGEFEVLFTGLDATTIATKQGAGSSART